MKIDYNKLNQIITQPLSYKQLCQSLEFEIKYGNSKKAQIKD